MKTLPTANCQLPTPAIPKRMFFYHGFASLSLLRFMTVYSFHRHHPDFEIRVVVPKQLSIEQTWTSGEHECRYGGPDHTARLAELPVELVPFDMESIGLRNDLPEAYKSDIVRNWLLANDGGYYSDMDVLYVGRMSIPEDADTLYCHDGKFYYIGLIGGCPGNAFYRYLWQRSLEKQDDRNYQCYGTRLYQHPPARYRQVFPALSMYNLPMSAVYPIKWVELGRFFTATELPPDCFGIHWFGGSRVGSRLERGLTHTHLRQDNLLYRKVREQWSEAPLVTNDK